jgi:hypothetical protein
MAEAPFYVDLLLWSVYVLLALTVVLSAWSLWHGLATRGRSADAVCGVPHRRIVWGTILLLLIVLALTFLFSSAEPLLVNGTQYGHRFWLRVADMFINSSILLIVLCSVLVAVGKFRH